MDSFRDHMEEDPIGALRQIRDENAKKYPTVKELLDYMDTVPSAEEILTELRKNSARSETKDDSQ